MLTGFKRFLTNNARFLTIIAPTEVGHYLARELQRRFMVGAALEEENLYRDQLEPPAAFPHLDLARVGLELGFKVKKRRKAQSTRPFGAGTQVVDDLAAAALLVTLAFCECRAQHLLHVAQLLHAIADLVQSFFDESLDRSASSRSK